jgi:hypothetical protein
MGEYISPDFPMFSAKHQETIISLKGNVKVSKGVKTVSGPVLTQLDLLMHITACHTLREHYQLFLVLLIDHLIPQP